MSAHPTARSLTPPPPARCCHCARPSLPNRCPVSRLQLIAEGGDHGSGELRRSSPIVTRRSALPGRAGAGGAGKGWAGSSDLSTSRPPLFEMHLEMNPRDPQYDAKVYLAVDQVSWGRLNGCCGRWREERPAGALQPTPGLPLSPYIKDS